MIYKSYFRKKSTLIYLLVITIAMTLMMLFNSFIKYYEKLSDDFYYKRTYYVIQSDNDSYDKLIKKKSLTEIERVLTFYPDYNYDAILNANSTSEMIDGTLVVMEDFELGKIRWSDLSHYMFDGNLIVKKDNTLSSGEIKIGLHEGNYATYKSQKALENTLNKKIGFIYYNQNYEFIIKDFYISNMAELKVSNELFDELIKIDKKYTYYARMASYSHSEELNELENTDSIENANVLWGVSSIKGDTDKSKIDSIVSVLTFITYVFAIILVIFTFIVTKNQINDLKPNLNLENKLGYSKRKIKLNLFMRLFLLYTTSLIISLVLVPILIQIIKLFKVNLIFPNLGFVGIVYLIIILIITIELPRNKNITERR